MTPKRSHRLGFSIAPLAAPLLYAAGLLLLWTDPTPKQEFSGFDSNTISAWTFSFAAFTLASYFFSLLFGIPLVSTLRHYDKLSFWWVAIAGVPLGAIAFAGSLLTFAALAKELKTVSARDIMLSIGIGGALAFAVASVFCFLAAVPLSSRKRLKNTTASGI